MSHQQFASDAWLLKGMTRTIRGWLELRRKRLRFVTEEGELFDVPLSSISTVRYPWYYFGGGLKLLVDGTLHRISFVRPNGIEHGVGRALGEAGNPAALLVAVSKVTDIRSGRAIGRRWRELLEAERA